MNEKKLIDDLFIVSGELSWLITNRENNSEFWKGIQDQINDIIKTITTDKRIFGW